MIVLTFTLETLMSSTVIPFGDPKAQKRWSATLAHDVETESYFSKFIGTGKNNIIERKTELEGEKGDRISFDLSVRLRQNRLTVMSVSRAKKKVYVFILTKSSLTKFAMPYLAVVK